MIEIQMVSRSRAPWLDKRIDACEPPGRLSLSNESGNMRTELFFSEPMVNPNSDSSTTSTQPTSAHWRSYMDQHEEARDTLPSPGLDDDPAMRSYYDALPTQNNQSS